ncbi:MotA/TolQ/ExbB proton channel [Planctopirus limnophila DSM 3776]|uniref:MotA/TolQ/ExbB proton channel n=1 Tax=Planctopirus limnophila (strain ATCC 43296 / DSM 3776 / IFAM 1008 / Mu 290) TaxID=521674 RepID=D5SRQ8_PLAL2|nr:MotA/TolQ/ExbB proton channel family protein [Planctopirus limnophila]ADG66592.1 MotA/TolQ/ExbB proton channel [Planctopirus limnophila DSM 3776]
MGSFSGAIMRMESQGLTHIPASRNQGHRPRASRTQPVHRKSFKISILPQACLCLMLCLVMATGMVAVHQSDALAQGGDSAAIDPSASGAANAQAVPSTEESQKPATKIPETPLEILNGLGVFVYPLGLASVLVLWVTIERLVVLRRSRVIPQPFVRRFFDHMREGHLDPKTSLQLCEENGSPISIVFAHGLRKWGKPSVEVEQAIIDGGERQTSQLRKHIRVLNGAATVAPLIGLLGTVAGMIESFNTIAAKQAMGRTEDLAAGIGLALLTTAAGLLIAIPALIMYMYFAGRVDSLIIEMDGLAQDLVDLISAEGLADQERAARSTSSSSKSTEVKKPA